MLARGFRNAGSNISLLCESRAISQAKTYKIYSDCADVAVCIRIVLAESTEKQVSLLLLRKWTCAASVGCNSGGRKRRFYHRIVLCLWSEVGANSSM